MRDQPNTCSYHLLIQHRIRYHHLDASSKGRLEVTDPHSKEGQNRPSIRYWSNVSIRQQSLQPHTCMGITKILKSQRLPRHHNDAILSIPNVQL